MTLLERFSKQKVAPALWVFAMSKLMTSRQHVNLFGNKCLHGTRCRQDHPAGLRRTNPRWLAQTPTLGSAEAPVLSQCSINAIKKKVASWVICHGPNYKTLCQTQFSIVTFLATCFSLLANPLRPLAKKIEIVSDS